MSKKIVINSRWEIINSDILNLEEDSDNSLLTEDMFQVTYHNYIIDSGWYEGQKCFITYLIHASNWSDPIIMIKSANIDACYKAISLVMNYFDNVICEDLNT